MQVQNQKRDRRGIKKRFTAIALLAIAVTLFISCNQNNGKAAMEKQKEQTITYGVGRFVIDIPVSMQYRGGMYRMRTCSLLEKIWDNNETQQSALDTWETRLDEIGKMPPPEGKQTAIIEARKHENIGRSCNSVLYHKELFDPNFVNLDMLLNSGPVGLWIKLDGKIGAKNIIYDIATEIAKAYRPPAHRLGKATVLKNVDSFYLEYGAIDLPFEYRESVDISFYGHTLDKKMELSIETYVVQEVQQVGLIDRLSAAIASKYAPGVKVEKIRAKKRPVAGLKGEELILRGTEDGKTALNFQWNYPGKADSAHHPEIIIIMDSQDGLVEEKIALWNSILDSMHPAGR
jgi:hypothetical protein